MGRVRLPETSLSIDSEQYLCFEEIRDGQSCDVSDQQLREMVALCDTNFKREEFSNYALERLGISPSRVCEFLPDLTRSDHHRMRLLAGQHSLREVRRKETARNRI